ncbi:MAG: ComEC/Rec2 family competence protein [Candidatus Omnitrophica bacterium]|nr:ComEC/Rec2 family competence protein [Candidatus Omnitrophota bacterium]
MHPALGIFISFALGIISGKFLSLNPFLLIFLSFAFFLSAVFFHKKSKLFPSDISILFIFLFLGFIWIKPYSLILPEEVLIGEVYVCGKIDKPARQFGVFRTYLIDSNYLIKDGKNIYYPASILVKDYSQQDLGSLNYYLFKGKLRKSGYGYSKYTLYISGKNRPNLVKNSTGIRKSAFVVSEKLAAVIKGSFPEEIAPFVLSIFLGRREDLSKEIKGIFADAGTSHILAISGLHVGIVAWLCLFVLKLVGFKRKTRLAIAMCLILFYAFICGLKPPVTRAAIMFICFCLSFLLQRKFFALNSLGLAGFADLLLRPQDLFSASFQLSFIAVFSIVSGFKYFYVRRKDSQFFDKIRILFFMSLFANLGLMPLVSFYFSKVYLLNIFTSVVIIPYLGIIISSLSAFLGLYLFSALRAVLSNSISFLIFAFLRINCFLSKLPFSYFEYKFSLSHVFLYYTVLITLLCIKVFSAKIHSKIS